MSASRGMLTFGVAFQMCAATNAAAWIHGGMVAATVDQSELHVQHRRRGDLQLPCVRGSGGYHHPHHTWPDDKHLISSNLAGAPTALAPTGAPYIPILYVSTPFSLNAHSTEVESGLVRG